MGGSLAPGTSLINYSPGFSIANADATFYPN
jgi:hypothetical protein